MFSSMLANIKPKLFNNTDHTAAQNCFNGQVGVWVACRGGDITASTCKILVLITL